MNKIVILDDSLTVRLLIEDYLLDMDVDESHIKTFEKGADALEFIKENTISLIISDLNMPTMSGAEFVKLVKSYDCALLKNFIIISAEESAHSSEYQKVKEEGIRLFVRKPINAKVFKHIMSRALKLSLPS